MFKTTYKNISIILLIILYLTAGLNHFINPNGYYSIIPPYLPNPYLLNIVAGIMEMIAAVLLIKPSTRKFGAYLIITMLVAFIPSHIYMIQKGGCMNQEICIPLWVAWLRLFPLQFILMAWAWWHRK